MRLEWRVGNISACFACIDKLWSGIWDWLVDDIVDELGTFALIIFHDGSLVLTMVVGASRYCPVHPASAIWSFVCSFCGDLVLLLGSVWVKLRCCWVYFISYSKLFHAPPYLLIQLVSTGTAMPLIQWVHTARPRPYSVKIYLDEIDNLGNYESIFL